MPACDRVAGTVYRLGGVLGEYVGNVSEQWLTIAPRANPAMLEMFRDRGREPLRDLVPWAGEFAGKYLTSAVQVLRLTGEEELRSFLEAFVAELVSLQADNGYLGPWPIEHGLTNRAPNCMQGQTTWDAWGHYHIMLGLVLWHEDTGDEPALACVRGMADRLCEMYLGDASPRLVETGMTEMNLAPAHVLVLLHNLTSEPRYRQLAEQIVAEFAAIDEAGRPLAGDFLEGPLAGREFFELPKPRWESLHPIMALAELFHLTGETRYREAFERIWQSIARHDRQNNGGFTSGEQATGSPYDLGAIETCCTIAWIALSVEMLRLTGDPRVADELELSTFNSVVGMHTVTGRWVTYDTPSDGKRYAFYTQHPWQGREGSPELNCCSVNGPRGLGMVSDWCVMRDTEGLLLNAYGPSRITVPLGEGVEVTLDQQTDYPFDGRVVLHVSPSHPAAFCLRLRIPRWSTETRVALNGEPIRGAVPGTYLAVQREWREGDTVEIELDLTLHGWTGEGRREGKTSLYRGPILLTYDRRYNDMDPDEVPSLDGGKLEHERVTWPHWLPPALLVEFTASDGRKLRLCDFGSAGEGGTPYRSWLKVEPAGAGLPQFFAPSPAERLRAEIGRYAVRYDAYRAMRSGQQVDPIALRTAVTTLQNRWPDFQRLCAEARSVIEDKPDAAGASSLEAVLARLHSESGIMDASLPEQLDRELDGLRNAPAQRAAVTSCEVSDLKPAVADIRGAPPPDEAEPFRTLQPRTDECWLDIGDVHGGNDGLVYLRATVTMARASSGKLQYGADGPVKLWINGREADCRPTATNPAKPREFAADVQWRQGANTLVFALSTNHGNAWCIHLATPLA